MKIIGTLTQQLQGVAQEAVALEDAGVDAVSTGEICHDPFIQLTLAATQTSRVKLMTSIAVAFARSPMTLAQVAHDLNSVSEGRFILGIGSQIKPHIEKRFSMPWSRPAVRMREYVLALKAIWNAWYTGEPLDFRGEFYTHTLMTPMFTPKDIDYGAPAVFAAAVGPSMTSHVAEVADGILLHSFTCEEYVRTVTLPAVEEALKKTGRERRDVQLVGTPFLVSGPTQEEFDNVKQFARNQIAFYGSTPAYRGVLESIGYEDLQPELNRLTKEGRWQHIGDLVDDALLDKIALVGEPQQIALKLKARYGDIFDMASTTVFSGIGYSDGKFEPALANAIREAN
ncbi:MAG: TIGR03617 family F420-dependent LLM class oxidoreductase [Pseudomonadota bacterium]